MTYKNKKQKTEKIIPDEKDFARKEYCCPICKSTKSWLGMGEEFARSKRYFTGPGEFALPIMPAAMADPNNPPPFFWPILSYVIDICYDCGCIYAKHVELVKQPVSLKPGKDQFGGPGFRGRG